VIQLEVEVKTVDNQGRIILPKTWRDRYLTGKKAIVSLKEDVIEIRPLTKANLKEYFDKVNGDLKADLSIGIRYTKNYGELRNGCCIRGC
jgi:bifunctional DNA-binding transcriptional regulator/antitoxin component of YhaV-PrlF toxin-antitoxin module